MYIGNVKCKENICRLILSLLFFKFDFYVAEKHGVLKLNATGNYVEISYPESFNLKCTGFDTLVWELETIFLNEAIRFDFRKELVYSKMGRTFLKGIFSFEGSFLSTRKFSCDFIHTAPEVPVSVCLSVIGKSESFVRYANMCSSEVEFGSKQELELSCQVNGVSHPKIKWFRNEKPVSALDDSSKLAIKEVDENHSGFYECKVEKGVAVETGKITQTVIRASYISPRSMLMDINSVDMTEIYCFADGTPLPKISWYHREGSLLDAIFQENFSAMNYNYVHTLFRKFLIDILKDTSSFFKCSVRKPFGIGLIMGNSTWIKVEAVRIYRTNMKSPMIEAYVDEDLELHCYMDGIPQPNLTWYFNGEPFPDNVTGAEFSDDSMKLVISRLVEGNSGLYECRAENKHGVVSYSSYLTVKKGTESSECNKRYYGHSKFVCVCDSSFCDSLDPVEQAPSGQAFLYETNKDRARFSRTSLSFSSEKIDEDTATINVKREQKYQFIVGFGGSFTDATGINVASLGEDLQRELINGYYSENGLEYTIGRVPMASCDFSTREYSYDDVDGDFNLDHFQLAEEDLQYKIPFIKMATSASHRDLLLIGSPWSAPAWMKTNGNMSRGGFLKGKPGEKHYKTWAKYFVKFLQSYQTHNITFWGLTTQNEPNFGLSPGFSFQSMGFTAESERDFIKLDLGPSLQEAGYGVDNMKLMIMDGHRYLLPKWAEVVLNDPEAAQYVSGVAFHWYFNVMSPSFLLDRTHDLFPNAFLLSSEACNGFNTWDFPKADLGNWERAEKYALDIIEDLLHWTVGWVDWNLALDLQGGPNWVENFVDSPIIVNETAQEFYKQPMYYVLAQFSKLLPPGSVRVGLEITQSTIRNCSLKIAAFETPDDSTVLIIVNGDDFEAPLVVHDVAVGYLNITASPHSIQSYVWSK